MKRCWFWRHCWFYFGDYGRRCKRCRTWQFRTEDIDWITDVLGTAASDDSPRGFKEVAEYPREK